MADLEHTDPLAFIAQVSGVFPPYFANNIVSKLVSEFIKQKITCITF